MMTPWGAGLEVPHDATEAHWHGSGGLATIQAKEVRHMTKPVALIFLALSLVMIVVSIWCVGAQAMDEALAKIEERRKTEMSDTDGANETSWVDAEVIDLRKAVLTGSASVGPWIVLLALSCIGSAMPKKKGA